MLLSELKTRFDFTSRVAPAFLQPPWSYVDLLQAGFLRCLVFCRPIIWALRSMCLRFWWSHVCFLIVDLSSPAWGRNLKNHEIRAMDCGIRSLKNHEIQEMNYGIQSLKDLSSSKPCPFVKNVMYFSIPLDLVRKK